MQVRQRLIELRSFDNRWLKGVLFLPAQPVGGVLLVDGTATGRLGSFVTDTAHTMALQGLATLVVDILTDDESTTDDKRFDIELLSARVQAGADGLSREIKTSGFKLGYFGMQTGAAAVLVAAAQRKSLVGGVVCYAPDAKLADNYRARVVPPVLNLESTLQDTGESVGSEAARWFLENVKTFSTKII